MDLAKGVGLYTCPQKGDGSKVPGSGGGGRAQKTREARSRKIATKADSWEGRGEGGSEREGSQGGRGEEGEK